MLSNKLSFTDFFNSVWLKIPQVWRDADKDNGRPLQLMTLTICQHMYYYFYEKIVNMDELFDPDRCPDQYLKFLASIIGWELIGQDPDSWRKQIKASPLLYKLRGTKRGLMLAEKLVGYSVFMSELYRDYSGTLTTKERLFNSFPISLRVKPWFRKAPLPDIADFIITDVDADTMQAYDSASGALITKTGEVFYPKSLRAFRATRKISTIKPYSIIPGEKSRTRLAKTTRYNFVLKKDTDLDYINPYTNKITEVNLEGAIDLLMKFKPFHIYIQDLIVMVSLSDYLSIQGSGNSAETLFFTDYDDTSVSIFDEEHVNLFKQSDFPEPCKTPIQDQFFNKGTIEVKKLVVYTEEKYLETSVNVLTGLGLPINGTVRKSILDKPGEIFHISQFSNAVDKDVFSETYNQVILFDNETHNTIRARDLGDNIKFGFYKLPLNADFEIVDLKQFFSTRRLDKTFTENNIISISHSPSNYYSGKIVLKVVGDNFQTLTQTYLFNN